MTVELMKHDKQSTPHHAENNDRPLERTWEPFVVLVIIILVEIGAMAVLCYKLEHPDRPLQFHAVVGSNSALHFESESQAYTPVPTGRAVGFSMHSAVVVKRAGKSVLGLD
jgi:hypothetical protein